MNLSFPTAQLVLVVVIIALATVANRSRGGGSSGAMILGLAFIALPALLGAAAYGWPGFVWGAIGTLVLMKIIGR